MQHTIRWGVMGTGWIAEKFCGALRSLEGYGAQLYAVGSRKKETADAFAARHGFARAYASYEELAADPNVDVVYIATPHRFHLENALLCIRSGRAILCEKAFTVNGDEAEKIAEEAKARGVFAMEAFWPRFQPLNRLLRKLVCEQKIIGDVRMLQVDFDKLEDWPDEHRIYNPELAGGTTLDLGIYTMSYAAYFLGADVRDIHAVATIGKGGVDDQLPHVRRNSGVHGGARGQIKEKPSCRKNFSRSASASSTCLSSPWIRSTLRRTRIRSIRSSCPPAATR